MQICSVKQMCTVCSVCTMKQSCMVHVEYVQVNRGVWYLQNIYFVIEDMVKGGRAFLQSLHVPRSSIPHFCLGVRVPGLLYEVFFSVPKFAFPSSRIPGQNNFPSTVKKCWCIFQYKGLRERNLFKLREHDLNFGTQSLLSASSVTYHLHFHIYLQKFRNAKLAFLLFCVPRSHIPLKNFRVPKMPGTLEHGSATPRNACPPLDMVHVEYVLGQRFIVYVEYLLGNRGLGYMQNTSIYQII